MILIKKRKISNKWKLIDHSSSHKEISRIKKIGAKLFYIIIIIINSCYCYYYYFYYYLYHNCYLEKKKATGWEVGFTNSVYMFICMLFLY